MFAIIDLMAYGRALPDADMETACREPLSNPAQRGIELFNASEYFEAHEYLEAAWKEERGPGREFYRAILQVAVAYLQIERGNYPGAVKMFGRLQKWINPLPEQCRGINVAKLREDARQAYQALAGLGKERISEFDRGLFKPVEYL